MLQMEEYIGIQQESQLVVTITNALLIMTCMVPLRYLDQVVLPKDTGT